MFNKLCVDLRIDIEELCIFLDTKPNVVVLYDIVSKQTIMIPFKYINETVKINLSVFTKIVGSQIVIIIDGFLVETIYNNIQLVDSNFVFEIKSNKTYKTIFVKSEVKNTMLNESITTVKRANNISIDENDIFSNNDFKNNRIYLGFFVDEVHYIYSLITKESFGSIWTEFLNEHNDTTHTNSQKYTIYNQIAPNYFLFYPMKNGSSDYINFWKIRNEPKFVNVKTTFDSVSFFCDNYLLDGIFLIDEFGNCVRKLDDRMGSFYINLLQIPFDLQKTYIFIAKIRDVFYQLVMENSEKLEVGIGLLMNKNQTLLLSPGLEKEKLLSDFDTIHSKLVISNILFENDVTVYLEFNEPIPLIRGTIKFESDTDSSFEVMVNTVLDRTISFEIPGGKDFDYTKSHDYKLVYEVIIDGKILKYQLIANNRLDVEKKVSYKLENNIYFTMLKTTANHIFLQTGRDNIVVESSRIKVEADIKVNRLVTRNNDLSIELDQSSVFNKINFKSFETMEILWSYRKNGTIVRTPMKVINVNQKLIGSASLKTLMSSLDLISGNRINVSLKIVTETAIYIGEIVMNNNMNAPKKLLSLLNTKIDGQQLMIYSRANSNKVSVVIDSKARINKEIMNMMGR